MLRYILCEKKKNSTRDPLDRLHRVIQTEVAMQTFIDAAGRNNSNSDSDSNSLISVSNVRIMIR